MKTFSVKIFKFIFIPSKLNTRISTGFIRYELKLTLLNEFDRANRVIDYLTTEIQSVYLSMELSLIS